MKIPPKTLLKILVSLGLMAFLFFSAGLEETLQRLSQANLWYIPVGVAIYLASQGISAYRWQFLSAALGFRMRWRRFYEFYLIGMYFNLFLPGAIGGDAGRMYYLAKECGRKKREALLTLVAERGVGLVALLILTTLVCLTPWTEAIPLRIRQGLVGMSLLGLVAWLVLQFVPAERWEKRFPRLATLLQAKVYWKNLPLLFKSVSISLFVHGTMILIHLLIAAGLGIDVSLPYLTAVYGIVSLVSVLPIAFNGIGVREGAYKFLLIQYGVSNETALAFGLYWFLISTLTSLSGGLVFLKGHYKPPVPEESETIP